MFHALADRLTLISDSGITTRGVMMLEPLLIGYLEEGGRDLNVISRFVTYMDTNMVSHRLLERLLKLGFKQTA